MIVIETERLILRTWEASDAQAYWQINQDSKVTEFLLGPLSMQQVHEFIRNCQQCFEENKFCLFAAELKDTHELIGFIGLWIPQFEADFMPAVEIGWRLGSQYWGKGYAIEGAKAVLEYGFKKCGLKEIVSFTVPANQRSIRVMEKLGMHHDPKDVFAHPKLAPDHPLSMHVLYRMR